MKVTQYFSKWRLIWVNFAKNEDPLIGMKNSIDPQKYVNLLLKYKYKIRTISN